MSSIHCTRKNISQEAPLAPRALRLAFTLVELLVVITIISILAALITVAAVGALKAMNRARIKTEINEISNAFDELKNKSTAYPPNCQTDNSVSGSWTSGNGPLKEADILNDLKRYIRQLGPRSAESDSLANVLTGQAPNASDSASFPNGALPGGIAADEAVVFWLCGFSSDSKYPISGDGGPSYSIPSFGASTNASLDPIESRTKTYPFDVSRLGPRDSSTKYFSGRFIEYTSPTGDKRRINFWTYTPAKSDQPFVYFDTSRHPAVVANGAKWDGTYDPPARTYGQTDLGLVFAFKKTSESTAGGIPVQFINPDKFQVFHCGIDNAWGDQATLKRMSARYTSPTGGTFLLFPGGPFVGDIADTEVNFAVESTIEDAQK